MIQTDTYTYVKRTNRILALSGLRLVENAVNPTVYVKGTRVTQNVHDGDCESSAKGTSLGVRTGLEARGWTGYALTRCGSEREYN